jgi:hypothetical protein
LITRTRIARYYPNYTLGVDDRVLSFCALVRSVHLDGLRHDLGRALVRSVAIVRLRGPEITQRPPEPPPPYIYIARRNRFPMQDAMGAKPAWWDRTVRGLRPPLGLKP